MYHHHLDLMLNVLNLIVFLNLVLLVVDRTVGFAVVGVVLELVADLNDVAVFVVALVLDVFVDGNNVVAFV
jgi:hypothetical protein